MRASVLQRQRNKRRGNIRIHSIGVGAKTEGEAKWRKEGYGITWVDLQPYWVSACDWMLWLNDPKHECIRVMRFVLIGGGQIKVQERFYADPTTDLIRNDWAYGLLPHGQGGDGRRDRNSEGKLATALAEMVCMTLY